MDWLGTVWFWAALALLLFTLEALAPGVLMLWFGLAAATTAILVGGLSMSQPTQWIVFSVLAIIAAGIGWRIRRSRPLAETDQPGLNKRASTLLGQIHALDRPIVNGRGRVKIGDAYWAVEGDELPVGTRVRIIGSDGVTLRVAAAELPHAGATPAN